MSPDDAVFARLSRLAQKLDDVKTERDQLLYQNQLLATDLKLSADLARGYCEERDTAEERVEELEDELSDAKQAVVLLDHMVNTIASERDNARAAASLGRSA